MESGGEGEEGGEAASKLYVPPRVVAMPYGELCVVYSNCSVCECVNVLLW